MVRHHRFLINRFNNSTGKTPSYFLPHVSASPFRVPVARLAAAQAAVREKLGIKGPLGE